MPHYIKIKPSPGQPYYNDLVNNNKSTYKNHIVYICIYEQEQAHNAS